MFTIFAGVEPIYTITNVLFQHAISLSKELALERIKTPVAFITVSKLLRSQLENMYHEIKHINNEKS